MDAAEAGPFRLLPPTGSTVGKEGDPQNQRQDQHRHGCFLIQEPVFDAVEKGVWRVLAGNDLLVGFPHPGCVHVRIAFQVVHDP